MRITAITDVERARAQARSMAEELGFGPVTAESLVLATAELAANLIDHAIGGQLHLRSIEGERAGVEVESEDRGPGMADLSAAKRDGFSTGPGLGSGLGAVERLMDESEFHTSPTGTRILARKWADPR